MKPREKLIALITKSRISKREAAYYIAEETKRPCSVRAVQAWLAEEESKSARPCQDWAVIALEARLKHLKKL
jgi:hypothetical protein